MSLDQIVEAMVNAELADETYITRTHGTPSCYNHGCRGELCKLAMRLYMAERRGGDPKSSPADQYLGLRIKRHHEERALGATA